MLDIDTLNSLTDLMAKTLYHAEVARLPKLSRAEEAELVTRARHGDAHARVMLVVSCLQYALGKAHHYYNTRQPAHDDELDLAQIASMEMLNDLDVALTKRSPVPYLRGIAARAMSIYLSYRSGFIRKPSRFSKEQLATVEIPTVERLDVPAYRNSTRLKMEIIEVAPPPDDQPEEDAEKREAQQRERFAPIYEALEQLTPRQRNMVITRYGLDAPLVEGVDAPKFLSVDAARSLRKALEKHLKQMLG